MNDDVAGKIVDAYKTSPLLTGLIVLLIGLTIGFGWYQIRKDTQVAAFIMGKEARIEDLQKQLIDAVRQCVPRS